jgi:hypothetical protein
MQQNGQIQIILNECLLYSIYCNYKYYLGTQYKEKTYMY